MQGGLRNAYDFGLLKAHKNKSTTYKLKNRLITAVGFSLLYEDFSFYCFIIFLVS
jgi:hypothetical protein